MHRSSPLVTRASSPSRYKSTRVKGFSVWRNTHHILMEPRNGTVVLGSSTQSVFLSVLCLHEHIESKCTRFQYLVELLTTQTVLILIVGLTQQISHLFWSEKPYQSVLLLSLDGCLLLDKLSRNERLFLVRYWQVFLIKKHQGFQELWTRGQTHCVYSTVECFGVTR